MIYTEKPIYSLSEQSIYTSLEICGRNQSLWCPPIKVRLGWQQNNKPNIKLSSPSPKPFVPKPPMPSPNPVIPSSKAQSVPRGLVLTLKSYGSPPY